MTVKELFKSLTFGDIMAALKNTHRNDCSIENMAGYKEAYDTICQLQAEGEGGEVTFDVTPREKWYEPNSIPMLANKVEGDLWENTVKKTVIKPVDNPFTDAELAGSILWGMTFYGFTHHDRWNPCRAPYSIYGEQAKQLDLKKYLFYIHDKKEKKRIMEFGMPYGIAFTQEIWDVIHYRQKHQNRSKRKRDYRMEKRVEQLEKLDKRQRLIDRLSDKLNPETIPVKEIIKAESINEDWFESHSYGKIPRVAYVIDLLENYCSIFTEICSCGSCSLVICYTAAANSLTPEEETRLKNFLAAHFPKSSNWQLLPVTDDTLESEMALQFIGIKEKTCFKTQTQSFQNF